MVVETTVCLCSADVEDVASLYEQKDLTRMSDMAIDITMASNAHLLCPACAAAAHPPSWFHSAG